MVTPRSTALLELLILLLILLAGADLRELGASVKPSKLTHAIKQADRLVVTENPRQGAAKWYESTDRRDIEALGQAIIIAPRRDYLHCSCIGSPAITLYRGEKRLAQLTGHHGKLIRSSLWESDAPLLDQERWLGWFDARNLPAPRQEVEESRANIKKAAAAEERWNAAMPPAIARAWKPPSDMFNPLNPVDPAALLLHYTSREIATLVQQGTLTPTQLEGAARHFGSWAFSKKHPEALSALPPDVKQTLWEHVQTTSGDDDKLHRAKTAFTSEGE